MTVKERLREGMGEMGKGGIGIEVEVEVGVGVGVRLRRVFVGGIGWFG